MTSQTINQKLSDTQATVHRLSKRLESLDASTEELLQLQLELDAAKSLEARLKTSFEEAVKKETAAKEKSDREQARRRNAEIEEEWQTLVHTAQELINEFAGVMGERLEPILGIRKRLADLNGEHVRNTRVATGEYKVDMFDKPWRNGNDLIPSEVKPLDTQHDLYQAAYLGLLAAMHEKLDGPLKAEAYLRTPVL